MKIELDYYIQAMSLCPFCNTKVEMLITVMNKQEDSVHLCETCLYKANELVKAMKAIGVINLETYG